MKEVIRFVCLILALTSSAVLASPVESPATNSPVGTNRLVTAWLKDLKIIDAAIEQWAMANQKARGDMPSTNDLIPWIVGGHFPKPVIGRYVIKSLGTSPELVIPLWELERFEWQERQNRYEAEQGAVPLPSAPRTGPSEGAR